MRNVLVSQLRSGDRLGRDVYSTPDVPPLLRAGVRVSESYRYSLERVGVAAVWIDDGLSEGIEPLEVFDVETKSRATTAIRDAFRDVTRTLPSRGKLSRDAVGDMTEVADLIVRDVTRNVHSALALNDLANADGYTLKHSLAPYPPGTRVVLSDGYCGLVKHVRPDAVRSPVVRIIMDRSGALVPAREIDLPRTPGLTVVSTQFEIPETTPA